MENSNNINDVLMTLGLDEKEAALYLAALVLGEAGMSELAKRAKLKRTSAYVVFNSLEKRGLMGQFKIKSGFRFVATKPDLLLAKIEKQLTGLRLVMPELRAIESKSDREPKISYYKGREGYLIAAEESLKNPGVMLRNIGALKEIHKIVGLDYDIKYYIPQRIKKHITFKALYFKSEVEKDILIRNNGGDLREIRFLPEKYISKTSTLILEDKVIIFSAEQELITVIIESKEIAESEKKKFDLIWDSMEAGPV